MLRMLVTCEWYYHKAIHPHCVFKLMKHKFVNTTYIVKNVLYSIFWFHWLTIILLYNNSITENIMLRLVLHILVASVNKLQSPSWGLYCIHHVCWSVCNNSGSVQWSFIIFNIYEFQEDFLTQSSFSQCQTTETLCIRTSVSMYI